MNETRKIGRRGFLAGAAALGAGLVTAGCSGTYDFASGFTGTSGGATRSTLVYWNLLSGGDGAHSGVGVVNALQMASAVLAALPLVFVFLLAQRQIVEGVAGTGLK
jgi:ABC-type glycerol-3-phosphate transport system permease component